MTVVQVIWIVASLCKPIVILQYIPIMESCVIIVVNSNLKSPGDQVLTPNRYVELVGWLP
jgi:hypothetical protein